MLFADPPWTPGKFAEKLSPEEESPVDNFSECQVLLVRGPNSACGTPLPLFPRANTFGARRVVQFQFPTLTKGKRWKKRSKAKP